MCNNMIIIIYNYLWNERLIHEVKESTGAEDKRIIIVYYCKNILGLICSSIV